MMITKTENMWTTNNISDKRDGFFDQKYQAFYTLDKDPNMELMILTLQKENII